MLEEKVSKPRGRPKKDRSNEPSKEKRPVGRPRKDGSRDTSFLIPEDKPTTPLPQKLKVGTSTHQIYSLLVQGYSRQEVADLLDMTPQNVSILMSRVMAEMDVEIREMKNNYVSTTYMRAEMVLRSLMPEIQKAINEERTPDTRVVSAIKEMAKLQADVLGVGGGTVPAQQAGQINNYYQTLNANGGLYAEAVANEQNDLTGEVMPQLEAYTNRDEDVIRLDGILSGAIEVVTVERITE